MTRDSRRDEIVATKKRVHELLRKQAFEHVSSEVELEGKSCYLDQNRHPSALLGDVLHQLNEWQKEGNRDY